MSQKICKNSRTFKANRLNLKGDEMNKFFQKNGLSTYAFSCGYIQQVKQANSEVNLSLDGCWHVKTRAVSGDKWECFDNLSDARKHWKKEVLRVFGDKLKFISKDKRYTYSLEYMGLIGPQYIVRFCGQYVKNASSLYDAKMIAYTAKTI